ncbi:MAG TPA: glycine cleavage T C-terminal barrel domain-containing protein, partial [Bacteroidales bacterium]|nr:glycine cleavage T C-terminal barrel domain-containing protein [Bacteroidales bacterium]
VDGNDFIDRQYLEKQKEQGIKRRLAGFELQEKGIARNGYPLFSADGAPIGEVTSGTMSPFTGKSIGMGYLEVPFHKKDTEILIGIRNKKLKAKVVRPPFIDKT